MKSEENKDFYEWIENRFVSYFSSEEKPKY